MVPGSGHGNGTGNEAALRTGSVEGNGNNAGFEGGEGSQGTGVDAHVPQERSNP